MLEVAGFRRPVVHIRGLANEDVLPLCEVACVDLISHKVFLQQFNKSQCPHKSVNLFFILVIVQEKLTDLWGI